MTLVNSNIYFIPKQIVQMLASLHIQAENCSSFRETKVRSFKIKLPFWWKALPHCGITNVRHEGLHGEAYHFRYRIYPDVHIPLL